MSHRSKVQQQKSVSKKSGLEVIEGRDHIQGDMNARITLLEYGDYQCPYCGEAYPIVKRIQKKYGGDLSFVFRNFPLTEVHPFAEFGAELAEASGAQEKFWEMHDYIYENQPMLGNKNYFLKYAGNKLGLDARRIDEEVSASAYASRIREDFISGVRGGVNGTPTFFVNGKRNDTGFDYESLTGSIDALLKKIGSTPRR